MGNEKPDTPHLEKQDMYFVRLADKQQERHGLQQLQNLPKFVQLLDRAVVRRKFEGKKGEVNLTTISILWVGSKWNHKK